MRITPARRRGIEYLDDPHVDAAVRARSLRDVARSNRWLGGRSAVAGELRLALAAAPAGTRELVLLDVGTGDADLPLLAAGLARRAGRSLRTMAVDLSRTLVAAARTRGRVDDGIVADALHLPLRDAAADIVLCSQLLHHFEMTIAGTLIAELHRAARQRVIISDLRRSWIAAGGFWALSFPLGFHPVTRHDGTVSVLRGFTAAELRALVQSSIGVQSAVRARTGFRLTMHWDK
jgi:SAM-dependent methyltransferase